MSIDIPNFLKTPLTRREALVLPMAALIGVACQTPADLVINHDLGEWKFWGTKKDGLVDFRTGKYLFEMRQRSLFVPRKYPFEVFQEFEDFRSVFTIERVSPGQIRILGAAAEGKTSRAYKSQWTYEIDRPDLTMSHAAGAYWKDLVFYQISWDNKILSR